MAVTESRLGTTLVDPRSDVGDAGQVAKRGLLKKVDAVTVAVPDLDAGLSFYVDVLGQRLKWRNDATGHAGLELPAGDVAASGGVLVTRTVKDLTIGSRLTLSDRGMHQLKGREPR